VALQVLLGCVLSVNSPCIIDIFTKKRYYVKEMTETTRQFIYDIPDSESTVWRAKRLPGSQGESGIGLQLYPNREKLAPGENLVVRDEPYDVYASHVSTAGQNNLEHYNVSVVGQEDQLDGEFGVPIFPELKLLRNASGEDYQYKYLAAAVESYLGRTGLTIVVS
jgi:hypothetical protein